MFSGIVEEKAEIKRIARSPQGCKLTVESGIVSKGSKVGDSISVNGACLTVVEAQGTSITFDVTEETLRRTNLTDASARKSVNLERSLKVGDRISGHFVTGHVDCVGKVLGVTKQPGNYAIDIEFPKDKTAYAAEKGSIAIDGVSLTIAGIKDNYIKIYLIPLTLTTTNLGSKKVGDSVNIEFDILGKYSLSKPASAGRKIDANFLKEHGFL